MRSRSRYSASSKPDRRRSRRVLLPRFHDPERGDGPCELARYACCVHTHYGEDGNVNKSYGVIASCERTGRHGPKRPDVDAQSAHSPMLIGTASRRQAATRSARAASEGTTASCQHDFSSISTTTSKCASFVLQSVCTNCVVDFALPRRIRRISVAAREEVS